MQNDKKKKGGSMAKEQAENPEMEMSVETDIALRRGYAFLAEIPSVLDAIDRGVSLAIQSNPNRGNLDDGEILSSVMDAVAIWLSEASNLEEARRMASNAAGRIGREIRRAVQRMAKRREREVPTAIGAESSEVPMDDGEAIEQREDGRTRLYEGCVLTYVAPSVPPCLPREDAERKPIPTNAYGEWFSLTMVEPWQAEMMRQYLTMEEVREGAKEMGLMVPMPRNLALGGQRMDKDGNPVYLASGEPAYRHPLSATLYGAQRVAERYTMGNVSEVEQKLAIDMARSHGAIFPVLSYRPSGGDPTYGLADSAPSAESAYFRGLGRWADEKAGSETLYSEEAMQVERFYEPVTRYRRKAKREDGSVIPRGTEKKKRQIRYGDRKHRGVVTQRGMVSSFGIPRQTISNRLRKLGSTFQKRRGYLLNLWMEKGRNPEPWMVLPEGWHAPLTLPLSLPLRVSLGGSKGGAPDLRRDWLPADSKWSGPFPLDSLELAIEQEAMERKMAEKQAAWQARQAEIREAWLLEVATDLDAYRLERESWKAAFWPLATLTV